MSFARDSSHKTLLPSKHTHHFATISNGRLKTTTRHLAALDFLSSISMINEAQIKQDGIDALGRGKGKNDERDFLLPTNMYKSGDGPGRVLPGFYAPTIRVPMEIRFKMKMYEKRNELKRWENKVLAGYNGNMKTGKDTAVVPPLLSTRLFFSRDRAYPLALCSIVKYDAGEEKARLENIRAGDNLGFEVFEVTVRDWRGSSYSHKLSATTEEELDTTNAGIKGSIGYLYLHDPGIFDDSDIRYGSGHRKYVQGGVHFGPVCSSIFLYANDKDFRKQINEEFMDRHPNLPPSLNFSEVRDLMVSLAKGCVKLQIEFSTGALAWICFERLSLQGNITKLNRNLAMAVSLLLSFKFSECFLKDKETTALQMIFEFIDDEWDVTKQEVIQAEFGAFVMLNFTLHAPQQHIILICNRLKKLWRQI